MGSPCGSRGRGQQLVDRDVAALEACSRAGHVEAPDAFALHTGLGDRLVGQAGDRQELPCPRRAVRNAPTMRLARRSSPTATVSADTAQGRRGADRATCLTTWRTAAAARDVYESLWLSSMNRCGCRNPAQ